MNDSIKAVIEKVKRLLALSQSDNLGEAANAMAAANKLLEQHRLSMADLTGDEDPIVAEREQESLLHGQKLAVWQINLIGALGSHYGVFVWFRTLRNGVGQKHQFTMMAGRKSDVEIMRYFFPYLSNEATRLAHRENRRAGEQRGKRFVNSYLVGFSIGMDQRLRAERAQLRTDVGAAIVKLDARADEARAKVFGDEKLKSRSTKTASVDNEALMRGAKAAGRIHMGQALSNGAPARALGSGA